MDHSKSDFTQGSILKKLTLFMIPVLGALILQAAYGRLIYLLLEGLEQQQDFPQFLQEVKF